MAMTNLDRIGSKTTRIIYDRDAKAFAKEAPKLLWWEFVGKPAFDRNLGQEFYKRSDISVLDLGTASARIPEYFVQHGIPGKNITGVELSPEQVKIARERVPEANFVVGDITNLDLLQGVFDLATSNMVFEFLDPSGLTAAFAATFKHLKPGGTFFYITTHPDKMKISSGLDKPGEFTTTFPWGGTGPNYYRTREDFVAATNKAGFVVTNVEDLAIPPGAREADPEKYASFAKYPHIRLVIKATKPGSPNRIHHAV